MAEVLCVRLVRTGRRDAKQGGATATRAQGVPPGRVVARFAEPSPPSARRSARTGVGVDAKYVAVRPRTKPVPVRAIAS